MFVLATIVAATPAAARAGDFEVYLPENTEQFLYLNWRQITGSALFTKHLGEPLKKALADDTAIKPYLDALGADLLKDIDYVVLATPKPPTTEIVAVVGGTFDPAKFGAFVAKQAEKEKDRYSVLKEGNLTVYKMATGKAAGSPAAFVIVEPKRVVVAVGSMDPLVKGCQRAAKKEAAVVKNKVIIDAAAGIAKDTSFLAVGDETSLGQFGIDDPNLAKLLKKLKQIKLDVRIDAGIRVEGTLFMTDADSAKELKPTLVELVDDVKKFVGAIALEEPALKPLAETLKGMKVTTKGTTLVLTGEVSGEAIEAIMKMK